MTPEGAVAPPGSTAATSPAAISPAAVLGGPRVSPRWSWHYGGHADQVADLWPPEGQACADPVPLVVLIHGGFWRQAHDRWHLSAFAADLARHGAAVASVEYRRVGGGGGWPGTFDDVARALERVPAEVAARCPGVDAGRVVLVGHSAGGHLALWCAARHRLPAASRWHRPRPLPVAAVVALAPVADLALAAELGLGRDAVAALLGGRRRVGERLPELDPAGLLPTGVPATVVHGTADRDVPLGVSTRYVAAARAVGDPVDLVVLDDVDHYALIDPATAAAATVRRLVLLG